MMPKYGLYILEGHTPVACEDVELWSNMMEMDRHVGLTEVGDEVVSTGFLGINHAPPGEIPILFETMIFSGDQDRLLRRYSTWHEAEVGHQTAVEMLKAGLPVA